MLLNNLPPMQARGVAIVRDRDGRPIVDGNPEELPEAVKAALTPQEYQAALLTYQQKTGGR